MYSVKAVDLKSLWLKLLRDRTQLAIERTLARVPPLEVRAVITSDRCQTERKKRVDTRDRSVCLNVGGDIQVWAYLRSCHSVIIDDSADGRAVGCHILPTMATTRHNYSLARLTELGLRMSVIEALLDRHPLCVYATGSYGRLEAWRGSDIDLFFLYDDADDSQRLPWTSFVRVAAHLIQVTEEMEFPPFSGDGRYLEMQYVGEMERVLGSPRDDSLNAFTARMLLLLESRPLYNSDVYRDLMERIIGFYFRDFDDHADNFLPTFLINDILRFWRTLTLNYEHHRLKLRALTDDELVRKKAESAVKNYKLKLSRLSTCFSMVVHLASERPPVSAERVLELCAITPAQRFEALRVHEDPHIDASIDRISEVYSEFLLSVQREDHELLDAFGDETTRRQAVEGRVLTVI
jgi:predicted nucleotidyltransferase